MKQRQMLLAFPLMVLTLLSVRLGIATNSSSTVVPRSGTHSAATPMVDNSWVPSGFGTNETYSLVG